MKYKMLVMDLDDTLLNTHNIIGKENKLFIHKMKEMGMHIVLCSGRSEISMREVYKELELENKDEYGICYNGAAIFDAKTKEFIFSQTLDKELAYDIIKYGEEKDICVQCYIKNQLLVSRITKRVVEYSERTGMQPEVVENLMDYINKGFIKILYNDNSKKLIEIQKNVSEKFENKIYSTFSRPNLFELLHKEVSKGLTVKRLSKKLGIKREEVICVGDSPNDISMIEWAGLGVAVSNAKEEVKGIADYITKANNDQAPIEELFNMFIKNN